MEQIVRWLKRQRDLGRRVWWTKLHGGPMQRAGLPDLLIVYEGRTIFCEVKRPGESPTPLQMDTLGKIDRAGAATCVVTSVEGVEWAVSGMMS